eukprot:CAMPEP_0168182816 /NCGR_PEP_ID=MMETSP0139_2-20121125/12094_1 /TAXON_ID=44445 /ORGANISM="Pseudo-nitzschia australis, Strain 10249 10 AB" /LENGTH=197 /DNA_ID=CAMNT_0008103769 /DNA_START=192 /DNA_END=785 /DNA_ORIENTATION=-
MRSSTIATVLVGLCAIESGRAWSAPKQANTGAVSRKSMLQTLVVQGVGAVSAAALLQTNTQPAFAVATGDKLPSGVVVEVVKDGKGIKPEVGELIAIRFAAYVGERKIDDIFDTSEPYYTRLGSGGLLKGVESTLPLMKLGDRWKLTIPGDLAFGPKGRPASAGKPRIPGNAEVVFDVEIVGLPGKEPELIELIGDE